MNLPENIARHIPALVRFCNYQERCTQDVLRKMYQLQVPKNDQETLLQYLLKNGLFDDFIFAENYTQGKLRIKGWGRNKIKAGLYEKQISKELIEKALDKIEEEEYLKKLREIADKQRKKIKATNDYELHQKLKLYMMRRGFETSYLKDL
jgi:regulatory protein